MQGWELGLEKQVFSFRKQREKEKLVESSPPCEAAKSREIFICPQAEKKAPMFYVLNPPIFGKNCIYTYKLLQGTEELSDHILKKWLKIYFST